jgi:hypothetical protein
VKAVVALSALAALVAVPAALADAVSSPEVKRLAASAAAGDASALERLRRVDAVDGRPVDLAAALHAENGELRARLATLAAGREAAEVGGGDAQREAARILDERRFHGSRVPRPLHGVLEWLGEKLSFLSRPFDWLADRIPGGPAALWTVIAALVVGLAAVVATRLGARRGGRLLDAATVRRTGRAPDPEGLERDAAEAERRGDLELALRLRFRAGLIRLARAEVIPGHEPLTSGQLRRLVRSQSFDRLALDLDEVVYGDTPASAEQVGRAREVWPRVLQEVRP